MPDSRSRRLVFFVQGIDVLAIDPNAGAGVSLIALAEKEVAAVAGDGDEIFGLKISFETESVNVIVTACCRITYAEHRGYSSEEKWDRGCGVGHGGRGILFFSLSLFRWGVQHKAIGDGAG